MPVLLPFFEHHPPQGDLLAFEVGCCRIGAVPTPNTFLTTSSQPDGLADVVPFLRATFSEAMAVYAFGSQVQGTSGPGSDLDLAILVPGYAPALALWNASQTLSGRLDLPVDLLDMRAASTVMQYQVLTTGRCLWAKQPDAGLFECYVLSEKLALDAARAGQLGDIAKSGKIYG